ncbi:hypothetical protein PI124_g9854 [Phytophthora idaei]|nr:hypothetical protein PI124_g9854 [Phytophthora idaei]
MNYEKLTQIFQVSKSHIFHASTLYKWHSLCAAGLQDFIGIQALQELPVLVSQSDLWLPAALSQWTFDALEGKLFSAAHLAGRLAPLRASAKRSGGAHNLTRTTEYSISRLNATQKWNTCMVVGLYSGLRFKMHLRIFKTAPYASRFKRNQGFPGREAPRRQCCR